MTPLGETPRMGGHRDASFNRSTSTGVNDTMRGQGRVPEWVVSCAYRKYL